MDPIITNENTETVVPTETVDTSVNTQEVAEYTEEDAIAGLLDDNIAQENAPEQTQEEVAIETTTDAPSDELDLNDFDLSFLGVENETPNQEQQEVIETAPVQEEQEKPNEMQEILKRLDSIQNQEEVTADSEELTGLKELAQKMQDAGLFPSMSEEDKQLLQDAKVMRDNLKADQDYHQQVEAHNVKVNELEAVSSELEKSIPGYSSEFMQKVVSNIAAKNPEAAQKILNNPMQLLTLWSKVGAKAQPSTKPTNVITSNRTQTVSTTDLDQKVKDGSASEYEEARWLMDS